MFFEPMGLPLRASPLRARAQPPPCPLSFEPRITPSFEPRPLRARAQPLDPLDPFGSREPSLEPRELEDRLLRTRSLSSVASGPEGEPGGFLPKSFATFANPAASESSASPEGDPGEGESGEG